MTAGDALKLLSNKDMNEEDAMQVLEFFKECAAHPDSAMETPMWMRNLARLAECIFTYKDMSIRDIALAIASAMYVLTEWNPVRSETESC